MGNNPGLADLARFIKVVLLSEERDLVILKAHLLVEEMLRKLVAARVPEPAELDDRFTFHHWLCVAKSVYPGEESSAAFAVARRLNRLRNALAHHLDEASLEAEIDSFITIAEDAYSKPHPRDLRDDFGRLHWALFHLFGNLSAHLHGPGSLLASFRSEES